MCFSAEASFAGSAVISAIGITTFRKAAAPVYKLFAAIPLIFGIQQFAEGILWITLKSGEHDPLQAAATYVFLVTALVIWPVMIPLAMWLIEENRQRKRILTGLLLVGALLGLYYAFCLIAYDVTPRIQSFHIQYIDEFPAQLVPVAFGCYLISTVLPLFVSSVRRMWVFGVLIVLSCLVTAVFFSVYLTSVWCFFAALISGVIFWILHGLRDTEEQPVEYAAS